MCFRKILVIITMSTLSMLSYMSSSWALPTCSGSHYIYNEAHCDFTEYYSDTKIIYGKGEVKKRRRHANWIFYWANGKTREVGYFNVGIRNGEWLSYNRQGVLIKKLNYNNNKK